MRKNNTIKILLVLTGLLFISSMFYLVLGYFQKEDQLEQNERQITELYNDLSNIESNMMEIEVILVDKEYEIGAKNQMLQQNYEQIAFMDKEITRMEGVIGRLRKDNRVSKEKILELENRLLKARTKVLGRYKTQIELLQNENNKLASALDSLVKETNSIRDENVNLSMSSAQKDAALRDAIQTGKAVKQIQAANFSLFNVKKSNKEEPIHQVRADKIDLLKVKFDILENNFAERGVKKLYLVIRHPQTRLPITNEAEGYGDKVKFPNMSNVMSYSNSGKVDYQRKSIPVEISFKPSKNSPFEAGNYTFQIWHDGQNIGEKILRID